MISKPTTQKILVSIFETWLNERLLRISRIGDRAVGNVRLDGLLTELLRSYFGAPYNDERSIKLMLVIRCRPPWWYMDIEHSDVLVSKCRYVERRLFHRHDPKRGILCGG